MVLSSNVTAPPRRRSKLWSLWDKSLWRSNISVLRFCPNPFIGGFQSSGKTICHSSYISGLSHVRPREERRVLRAFEAEGGWVPWEWSVPWGAALTGPDSLVQDYACLEGSLLTTYVTDLAVLSWTVSSALQYLSGRFKGRMKEISDAKGLYYLSAQEGKRKLM